MQQARFILLGERIARGLLVGALYGLTLAGLRADSIPDSRSVITAWGGATGTVLSVAIAANTNQVIELTWIDLGAGYFYTVQERSALGIGQWMASPNTISTGAIPSFLTGCIGSWGTGRQREEDQGECRNQHSDDLPRCGQANRIRRRHIIRH